MGRLDPPDPRPLKASLDHVARSLGGPDAASLNDVFGHWADLVGPQLAAHARPLSLSSGVLIVAVTLHVVFTVQLARQSRRARPVRYSGTKIVQASYASRTMRWGGAALFLFIEWRTIEVAHERATGLGGAAIWIPTAILLVTVLLLTVVAARTAAVSLRRPSGQAARL